jgi:hypothetical protein
MEIVTLEDNIAGCGCEIGLSGCGCGRRHRRRGGWDDHNENTVSPNIIVNFGQQSADGGPVVLPPTVYAPTEQRTFQSFRFPAPPRAPMVLPPPPPKAAPAPAKAAAIKKQHRVYPAFLGPKKRVYKGFQDGR